LRGRGVEDFARVVVPIARRPHRPGGTQPPGRPTNSS